MPVVIDEHGVMHEVDDADGRVPAALDGLDRFEAREQIVEMLAARRARSQKVETHQHAVRHCYRCDTVVEPRLSDQWFVKMEPLARPRCRRVRDGAIRILPERWEAVYVNWLTNIRDWNISRQLWWGHRIPVWYCDECDPPQNIIVSRDDVTRVSALRLLRCVRTRTCSTRGSRRGSGRSRRSAGRTRSRPTSPRSIRPTRSSPPRRFSSSGSRA